MLLLSWFVNIDRLWFPKNICLICTISGHSGSSLRVISDHLLFAKFVWGISVDKLLIVGRWSKWVACTVGLLIVAHVVRGNFILPLLLLVVVVVVVLLLLLLFVDVVTELVTCCCCLVDMLLLSVLWRFSILTLLWSCFVSCCVALAYFYLLSILMFLFLSHTFCHYCSFGEGLAVLSSGKRDSSSVVYCFCTLMLVRIFESNHVFPVSLLVRFRSRWGGPKDRLTST